MRIVFMGTPDIAAACLEKLLTEHMNVVAVYTKPDTPQNRGMKLTQSPVKRVALAHEIPVYQPAGFREAAAVEELRALKPDVIAVVAYGRILPQVVLDIPPRGCINIHASLLPALRGSGPVQWAVLRGLEETGVTAMFMAAEMDAGDMIATRKTPVDPNENAQSLLDRLAVLGADLLAETLKRLEQGPVAATPQDPSKVTFAPMLTKDMCPIDWTRSPREIWNHIRGLDPWPVATMELAGKRFRVYEAAPLPKTTECPPGTPLAVTRTGLEMACGQGGVLEIRVLQADGGKTHGRAGLLPGPSPSPVRRRHGCKTDGLRGAHRLPEAGRLVRRGVEGIRPARPAGPAGRGSGNPAVLRRASEPDASGFLPEPAGPGQAPGFAAGGAGHSAPGPVSDFLYG